MNYQRILKKIISLNIIFQIIIIGFFSVLFFDNSNNFGVVSGASIVVSKDGTGDYSNIQDAIYKAKSGDIIYVWAGNYYENLFINKEIKIIGNGSSDTYIRGSSNSNVIIIQSNNVTLSGFNITYINPNIPNEGFVKTRLDYIRNVTIEDNTFFGSFQSLGVWIIEGSNNSVINNTFIENYNGIELTYSSGNVIEKNRGFNSYGCGIIAHNSDLNYIQNNSFNKNGYDGIWLIYSDNNIVFNNNCSSNKMHGIFLKYANSNLLKNNKCKFNLDEGILIDGDLEPGSQSNVVINNSCINNINSSILIRRSYSNKIINNYCKGSKTQRGIFLYKSKFTTVEDNLCDTNFMGNIRLVYSDSNNIINNSCLRDGEAYTNGIDIIESKQNYLKNNKMNNCSFYFYAFELDSWNTHKIDTSNTIDGKPIIYWSNRTEGKVPNNGSMVILANCSHVEIDSLQKDNLFFAIQIGFSNNNIIQNNNLTNGIWPIILQSSNNNKINNNYINNSSMRGIYLIDAHLNQIENNSISNVGKYLPLGSGIRLEDSNYNNLFNNSCNYNNLSGINLFRSKNNNILNNNLSNNIQYGIYLNRSSDKNIIINNLVKNNSKIGLFINNSNTTEIYHNNFLFNNIQASVKGQSINNHWYNSNFEGNFWSDYNGLDNGSGGRIALDGIGDTDIPHLELDNYPLMNISGWQSPGVPRLIAIIQDQNEFDSDGNYTIMWQPVRGAVGYILEEANTSSFNEPITILNGTEKEYEMEEKPHGIYYYRVKAYSEKYESAWSNVENIVVDLPPEAPENLTLIAEPEGNMVNISWETNTGSNDTYEYELFNKRGSETKWRRVAIVKHPNNFFNHTNLLNNITYEYKLRAIDLVGQISEYTESKNITPSDILAPSKPIGLRIVQTTSGSVHFSWDANFESDLEGYRIYRGNLTNPYAWWDLIAETDFDVMEFNDTSLTEQTEYHYMITAIDEVPNESDYSSVLTVKTKLGKHAPFINNSYEILILYEDTIDYLSLNLFEWFKDINNDQLIFRYSGNENIVISVNNLNGEIIINPKRNWNGNETITFYCSDGEFEVCDNITIIVLPVNDPPEAVKIISPNNNIEISESNKIILNGDCIDPDIPNGDKLTFNWSSNINGYLGQGQKLFNQKLLPGSHEITLSVTDSAGESSSATINMTVYKEEGSSNDYFYTGIVFSIILFIIILILFIMFSRRNDLRTKPLFHKGEDFGPSKSDSSFSASDLGIEVDPDNKSDTLDKQSVQSIESKEFLSSYMQPQFEFQIPMIGRGSELNELRDHLESTINGSGNTIMVSGEAGIGKSRLVFELFQIAHGLNVQILTASGAYESQTPYSVFHDALKPIGLDHLLSEETPKVEAVHLVSNSGLLIKEVMRNETKLDPDIFASMLNTIGDFVKESLSILEDTKKDGFLKSIGFENYRILIESGKGINLVVLITGKENDFLINEIKSTYNKINDNYSGLFENWNGEDTFKELEEYLNPLITSGRFDGPKSFELEPKKKRERLFENVILGLKNESKNVPILLCIENLHWLDPSSLALFKFISEQTKDAAIFTIGTYRPEDLITTGGTKHPLIRTLQVMKQAGLYSELTLNRLEEDQIKEMLISILSPMDLEKGLLDRLYKETEGNPLFVIQLVKFLIDEGILEKQKGKWRLIRSFNDIEVPPEIYSVIIGRLNRLDKKNRKILDLASVIGDTFTSRLLARASKLKRVTLLEHLKDLEKEHKIIFSNNGGFRFSHTKIKEALYSELPSELKEEYHFMVANSLEKLNKNNLDAYTGDLTFHYYHSRNKPKALKYLYKAASSAKNDYSLEEGIRFYIQALELENDRNKILKIFLELGNIYELIEDFERSLEMYDNAINLSDNKLKKAEIKSLIGEIHIKLNDHRSARETFEEELKLFRKLEHHERVNEIKSKLKDLKKNETK